MASHIGSKAQADNKGPALPQSQLMKIADSKHNIIFLVGLRLFRNHKILFQITLRRLQLYHCQF